MIIGWAPWKPFPNPEHGEHIQAPIGPGVYEVRHTGTGATIAFGHSENVAQALAALLPRPSAGLRAVFALRRTAPDLAELEYRTCAATTMVQARAMAERLNGRRNAFWRRRMVAGWA